MKASQLLVSAACLAAGTNAFAHFANVLKETDGGAGKLRARLAALADDPDATERLLAEHAESKGAKRNADPQLLGLPKLDLPLGGGLLRGILQPLTGVLQNIQIPLPQPQGLKEIPGDDPNHQFQKPGPTDVRGMCPTLNALANHGYIRFVRQDPLDHSESDRFAAAMAFHPSQRLLMPVRLVSAWAMMCPRCYLRLVC